ncbi:retrovirus-related Pol polyprotein from transposon 297 [Trichonephila clavipes]|nr:retrovirus-related Pol polyprotein from transposon 297 [Trichonephila clavipes]
MFRTCADSRCSRTCADSSVTSPTATYADFPRTYEHSTCIITCADSRCSRTCADSSVTSPTATYADSTCIRTCADSSVTGPTVTCADSSVTSPTATCAESSVTSPTATYADSTCIRICADSSVTGPTVTCADSTCVESPRTSIWKSGSDRKAVDVVKAAITKVPVLKLPYFKKPFELFTDASSIGVGAVLNQEQRPVVFASRTLSAAERKYIVTERECLAVVWALNKFRTYLGFLPIKVITDHVALTRLTHGKNLSNRMIRWALKLAEFNIEREHLSGTLNAVADVLSRNPIESIIGENVHYAIIRDLELSSQDQLIEEQITDPELGHIYR